MFPSPGISAFSDDSDNENAGQEFESENDSDFEAAAAEQPTRKKSVAAAPPAPVANPVIAAQSAFDALQAASAVAPASKEVSTIANEEKMAIAIANALRGFMGPSMPVNDGSKQFKITLSYSGSLKELMGKKDSKMKLVCQNPQLAQYLGSNDLPLREMVVLGYENKFPVSFGISGDHLKGKKFADHVTDTGLHMLEAPANTQQTFSTPIKVYACLDSKFKREMAQHFPNVKVNEIGSDIMSMGNAHKGFKLVPADSIVMAGVNDEIKQVEKRLAAKGEKYSGVRPEFIPALGMYKVADDLAVSAVNLLQKSFAETDDLISVATDLFLVAERSRLSSNAIETRQSAQAASVWADKRELKESLKSGHTIENQLEKRYDLTLTVALKISA